MPNVSSGMAWALLIESDLVKRPAVTTMDEQARIAWYEACLKAGRILPLRVDG
jgi:hypothetical protein